MKAGAAGGIRCRARARAHAERRRYAPLPMPPRQAAQDASHVIMQKWRPYGTKPASYRDDTSDAIADAFNTTRRPCGCAGVLAREDAMTTLFLRAAWPPSRSPLYACQLEGRAQDALTSSPRRRPHFAFSLKYFCLDARCRLPIAQI